MDFIFLVAFFGFFFLPACFFPGFEKRYGENLLFSWDLNAIYSLTPSILLSGPSNSSTPTTPTTTTPPITTKEVDVELGNAPNNGLLKPLSDPEKAVVTKDKNDTKDKGDKASTTTGGDKKEKDSFKSVSFPIPLALTILILWIAFSAAMFCIWETEWGFFTSVYFFFVSISTVGLGDIVPSKPNMMFLNFLLILIGLALLSMCVNLIQDALERLIEQLIEEYINEIEKIAAVVNNTDEFAEESSTPFEVGMTAEMLTVPLTCLAKTNEAPGSGSFVRSIKDWMAERIANNVLMERLDPHHGSDSSDFDSDESEMEDLPSVGTPVFAKASVVEGTGDDSLMVPKVSFNEGTPVPISDTFRVRVKGKASISMLIF